MSYPPQNNPAPSGGWGQPGPQMGPPQQGWGAAPAQGGGGNSTPLIIVLVLLLLAAAGGGAYFLTQDDEEGDSEETQQDSDEDSGLSTNQPTTTAPGGDPTATTLPGGTTVPGSVTAAETPDVVASAFFTAFLSGDCSTAVTYMSSTEISSNGGEAASVTRCEQEVAESLPPGVTYSVDSAVVTNQTDTTASVDLTLTATAPGGTNSETAPVELMLEGDAWKVSAVPQ